jgi:hypothetical protein
MKDLATKYGVFMDEDSLLGGEAHYFPEEIKQEYNNGDDMLNSTVAYAIFMETKLPQTPPDYFPPDYIVPVYIPYPPPVGSTPYFPIQPNTVIQINTNPKENNSDTKQELENKLIKLLDSALKRVEGGELLLQYSDILKTLQKM